MWKLIKESSKLEKFGLLTVLLGMLTCLLPPVNCVAFILWILVLIQDISALNYRQYITELQAENISLLAAMADLELPKEVDNE